MKKHLLVLIGLMVMFCACTSKTPPAEKTKDATEKKTTQQTRDTGKEASWGDAPDFTLPKVEGGSLSLSEFKGKVIILNFWATWCPPCRAEIPDFIELSNKYNKKGLVVIGVSLDKSGVNTVKQFMDSQKINYPIIMGNSKVTRDYGGIRGIPTTFIIDRKGNLRKKFQGLRSKKVFEDEIKKLF
jgi:peroxiredoxin